VYGCELIERLQVDDPISAVPLHGFCGVWGLLVTGLLAHEDLLHQVRWRGQAWSVQSLQPFTVYSVALGKLVR
jgi:ammonia channel protein AmtB